MPKWKAVVYEEVRALEKNGTWILSDLPHGKNPICVSGYLPLNTEQMAVYKGSKCV